MTLLLELKVPVAAVLPTKSWAKSRVLAAATVTSRSGLMPPSAKLASKAPPPFNRHQGVLDLQVPRRAPELGGVHEARGREAVDRDVGRGGDPAAVLQGGYSGVDVVDGGPQTVEGCDQRIARVRLALRPTVAGDLEGAAVAQDGLGGERGLAQQVADAIGGALRLHQIDDAPSLSAAVGDEVPGVQGYEIAGPQEAAVRFGRTSCRFGCGAWTGSPESRRPSAALPGRGCG